MCHTKCFHTFSYNTCDLLLFSVWLVDLDSSVYRFCCFFFLVLTYVRYRIKTVKIAKQSETINLYSGAFFNVISVYDILTFLHGYSI